MKQFVQALSGRAEFLIVVLGSIGVFLLQNFAVLLSPEIAKDAQPFDNESLVGMLMYEIVVLACLGTFMKFRGWTRERLGIAPNMRDTVIGILLAMVILAFAWVTDIVVADLAPGLLESAAKFDKVTGTLDTRWIVLVSLVNPVFEEVFICAYVISALKDKRESGIARRTG